MDREYVPVRLPHPGRRTRVILRTSKGLMFAILTLLTLTTVLPANAIPDNPAPQPATSDEAIGSQDPQFVGADPVPDLSLPRTVLSSVDNMIGAGGVIQTSASNLTIYNLAVNMRLLGGPVPHDELLDREREVISSYSFWGIQARATAVWVPLLPTSSNFTILGTNTTGTYVIRTMQVASSPYSGVLSVVYKATSAGPLKWDLEFTSGFQGEYRLVYAWTNASSKYDLSPSLERLHMEYGSGNYTLAWDDVPDSLNVTAGIAAGVFSLFIDLGTLGTGSKISVDPNVVGSSTTLDATAYTFQRKAFFEPQGARYWTFFNDGAMIKYASSSNGLNWSPSTPVPDSNFCCRGELATDVYNGGQNVIIAAGDRDSCSTCFQGGVSSFRLNYWTGTISGESINWQPKQQLLEFYQCTYDTCIFTIGIRNVNVDVSSDGSPAFSYNYYGSATEPGRCGGGSSNYSWSVIRVYSRGWLLTIDGKDGCGQEDSESYGSVILPADSQGGMRVVYQFLNTVGAWKADLRSKTVNGNLVGVLETIHSADLSVGFSQIAGQFSALTDAEFGTHVVYKGPDGTGYAYRSVSGTSWTTETNIINGSPSALYPTITLDASTNDLYVLAQISTISFDCIVLARKPPSQTWADQGIAWWYYCSGSKVSHLSSNLVSVGSTNSSWISLVWTEGSTPPVSVKYMGIPIPSVWSPYSFPDPWDGNGLVPNGEYFASHGEYVSPSSGMLAVKHTDLTVPGRGLDLEISRVYVEPPAFAEVGPWYYESSPWAPMGKGWRLDLPWLNNVSRPLYLHLWNGQGYRIPSSFWSGTPYENHKGDHFRMVLNTNGSIAVYTKSATTFQFDSDHKLSRITDATRKNTITLRYANNLLNNITDTVGRVFLFCYNSNNLIARIDQVSGGNCSGEVGFVRRVQYTYSGQNLVAATDPIGRVTSYRYEACAGCDWLLSRVTYPTQWYTNYTYTKAVLGTDPVVGTYRISSQCLTQGPTCGVTSIFTIRRVEYLYREGPGNQVINSTIRVYQGPLPQPATHTDYAFSFAGMTRNVSDASRRFISGVQERFGTSGEIVKQIFLVTDGVNIGSYTNLYRYDLWGNLIYSKISSTGSLSQERFSAYYNNGLQPGFRSFQETFTQSDGKSADMEWSTRNGAWTVKPGTAFKDTMLDQGWTDEVYNTAGQSKTLNDGTIQLTATFTPGVAGFYRMYKDISPTINGNAYPYVLVRLKSSIDKNLLRVELRDGSTYFDPTDGAGDVWRRSKDWNIAVLSLQGRTSINHLKIGITSEGDTTISGTQSGHFDYVFLANYPSTLLHDPLGELYGETGSSLAEDAFVWTDTDKSDLTFQARLFVNSQVGGGDRVGIFVHHPGTGNHKWALVFRNWNSVTLLEEHVQWRNTAPFTPSYNTWYWFKLKALGNEVWGKVWKMNDPEPGWMVHDFFTQDLGAKGAGLYAGGYRAFFDDVTVESEGFSNSFIPNGSPDPNVHAAPAGTAGFQDNLHRVPLEAFYSYYPWGGLKETKHRYDSPTGLRWISASMAYDSYGNLVQFTDSRGNATSYSYSSSYNQAYLTGTTHTLIPGQTQITSLYGYDGNTGMIVWARDPNLNNITYTYDILDRPKNITYPSSAGSTAYSYNDTANYVEITNANGWRVRQHYDGIGRLVKTERLQAGTVYSQETYANDWADRLIYTIDPRGRAVVYQYDVPNRTIRVTKPDGNTTLIVYDDYNSRTRQVDEHGVSRCSVHDRLGRLLTVIEGANDACVGTVTNYYYNRVGNLEKVSRAGWSTIYSYDSLNRLTRVWYPDFTYEYYFYDDNGNLVRKEDRKGIPTVYAYDSLNRPITVTYCGTAAKSDSYTHDNNGNLRTLANANATLTYAYDARNRVLNETYTITPGTGQNLACPPGTGGGGDGGGSVAYGTLITMADGTRKPVQNLKVGDRMLGYDTEAGKFTVSTITELFAVATENMLIINTEAGTPLRVDANPAQTLWAKKPDGTVGWTPVTSLQVGDYLFHQDQKWVRITGIEFAPKGRHIMFDIIATAPYFASGYLDPQQKRLPPAPRSGGGIGTLAGPSDGSPPTYTVGYAYDGDELASITYPDGLRVRYEYDDLGRVSGVSNSATSIQYASFSYYPDDQLLQVNFENGLKANYTYDAAGRPSRIGVYKSNTALLSLSYQYNKTGTVSQVTGSVNQVQVQERYRYDAFNRLTNTTLQKGSVTTPIWYQYDVVGNRVKQKVDTVETSYVFSSTTDRLLSSSVAGTSTTTVYSYNPNGNLATRNVTSSGVARSYYSWNGPGQLLKVSQVAGNSITDSFYLYDGLGRRLQSSEGGTTTQYAYLGTEILYEKTGTTATDYIYAGGLRIAKVSGGAVNYYHTDHLGSTRLVTDRPPNLNNVAVVWSDIYQPFGQDHGSPNCQGQSCSEKNKFTGKPYSSTTGLYYYGARWYDSEVGRFISADPLPGRLSRPQTLNPYTYVVNSPTNYVDPWGMISEEGRFTNACAIDNWGGCGLNAIMAIGGWYQSLSPEHQQIVGLTAAVTLTVATAGTAALPILAAGALGFGIGAGAYAGYTYATGGTPTLAGVLEWGGLGFMAGTITYGGYKLFGRGFSAAERLAANRAAGLGFEAKVARVFGLTRNIGSGRVMVPGTGTVGRAVPDFTLELLGEAKFTNYVYRTRQLNILIEASAQQGRPLHLYLPRGADIADTLFDYALELKTRIIPVFL